MINSTTQEEPANTVSVRRNKARKSLTSSSKKQETGAVNSQRMIRQDSTPSKPSERRSRSALRERPQQSERDNCEGCIEVVDTVTATGEKVTRILCSKRLIVMAPANKAQQKKVHFNEKVRFNEKAVRVGGERKKRRGLQRVSFFGATVILTPTTQSRTRKCR